MRRAAAGNAHTEISLLSQVRFLRCDNSERGEAL